MEIHHQPSRPDPDRGSNPLRTDFTRRNREGIERNLERVQAPERDRVELSLSARNINKDLETASKESAEHRQRVAALMEQYSSGTLNTTERIERAAEGMLGSTT